MKVFVAGGTGVLGRRFVPALVARGDEVTVLVRSAAKEEAVRRAGARPVQVSLFDREGLFGAVGGHDVVINVATSIPPLTRAARSSAWEMNDRIRSKGSRNLVDAALAADIGRFVQESVTFLYVDGGSAWLHEEHPVRPTSITASALVAEDQVRRLAAQGAEAVILRFGALYGPDSHHTLAVLRLARLGLGVTPGPRTAYLSSVTTDDAAAAVLAVATAAAPGTYNVVDDEPLTREEFDRVLARAVGRERLRSMPAWAMQLGGDKLEHVSRSQRVANQALRTATTWTPRCRSVREGMAVVAGGAGKGR